MIEAVVMESYVHSIQLFEASLSGKLVTRVHVIGESLVKKQTGCDNQGSCNHADAPMNYRQKDFARHGHGELSKQKKGKKFTIAK